MNEKVAKSTETKTYLIKASDRFNWSFEWVFLGLYALSLAAVTFRHQMWEDELQAWLIARDSKSLLDLFHNLHYEGHPALWYLILYFPARLSWNPIWMQVINYLISVTVAWLILSARKLNWTLRILLSFSYFLFFQYGVISRNYMLTTLLLIAAIRCIVGQRRYPKLAAMFFALSINTHFFAIPIAMVFAMQMLYSDNLMSRSSLKPQLKSPDFQAILAILIGSTLIAYLTIRPPADAYLQHGQEKHSIAFNILWTERRSWQSIIPPNPLTAHIAWLGASPGSVIPSAVFSLTLFLLFATSLRTFRARFAFLATVAIETVVMSLVYPPALWHLGFFFVTFILALFVDNHEPPQRQGRPGIIVTLGLIVVFASLISQTATAVMRSRQDWNGAYSYAEQTSSWLLQSRLDKNPLAIMPYTYGASILGYMQRPSAYYPACNCFGSFAILRAGMDQKRVVTENELATLSGPAHLPVVVISGWELPIDVLQDLRLKEIRAFSGGNETRENFYIYELKVDKLESSSAIAASNASLQFNASMGAQ